MFSRSSNSKVYVQTFTINCSLEHLDILSLTIWSRQLPVFKQNCHWKVDFQSFLFFPVIYGFLLIFTICYKNYLQKHAIIIHSLQCVQYVSVGLSMSIKFSAPVDQRQVPAQCALSSPIKSASCMLR